MDSSNDIVAEKLFALANTLNAENTAQLKEQLTAYINDLIIKDFPSLVQLLYRIDVDEKKLKNILQKQQHTDAAIVISELIIERQMRKKEMKQRFKKPGDTSEDELW
ncbi:MAG: hypothetical protein ABI594_01920 [Ginsengibacter sp.]